MRSDARRYGGAAGARVVNVIHFPPPLTFDLDEIETGMMRAKLQMLRTRTASEKESAAHWAKHWRWLRQLRDGQEKIATRGGHGPEAA